jgi:hypothetical protein
MDQKTDPPVKPGKAAQLELEPTKANGREALLQATAPHIDPNSPAYQADLGKVDAIATAERAREMLDRDDFVWNAADNDAVILKEQRATAVYHNRCGELVIRQKADWDDEGDTFVFVMPENCNAFIDGIAARIRQGGGSQ